MWILILGEFISLNLSAQELLISGEIRSRSEYRDGYSKPLNINNDPGVFTSQRSRLSFAWNSTELNTLVTLQDARVFGQESHASSTSAVGIYEAWADVALAPGLRFKIGRQAIKYDDNRLFSAPAWSLTGNSHDLALLTYQFQRFQLHIASAYNNKTAINSETFYTPGTKYRMMNYLWLTYPLTKSLTVSGIVVDEALQDTIGIGTAYKKILMNHGITLGGNLGYKHADFPVSGLLTTYFQTGENEKGYLMRGKMLALKVNCRLTKSVDFSLGGDYFSGDADDFADSVQQNFKKLYGADHTFNGYMDYWNTPVTEGLLDYYGCTRLNINEKISVEGSFHLFYTDLSLKKAGVETGKDLGSELDLLINYKLNKISTVQVGYCRYFVTANTGLAKAISVTIATGSPQWAYVMFTFNPVLLNTKNKKK
jgi:hypothetical protein